MKQQAKEAILARIRTAIANAPEPPPVLRAYRERDARERAAILEDFIDRLIDYKAIVTRADGEHLPQTIAQACGQHGITRLVVPADLPAAWIPEGLTVLRDSAAALPRRPGYEFRRPDRLRRRYRSDRHHHP